jgi:phage tail-like protein
MASWVGRGGGRKPAQPSIVTEGGPGRGGGRSGGQPSISSSSSWVGKGKGRGGGQPSISGPNGSGARSEQATAAWRSAKGTSSGKVANVADPEGNYIFALEIDGIEVAQFLECSGLKTSTEVFEIQEGGMNHRVYKLFGQSRWENLQLRYGVTFDVSLLKWRDEILQDKWGASKRRNGSIVIKNNQMEVVRRYNFVGAWPVGWEGPSLSSTGAELAIEAIELAHAGLSVA